MFCRKCGKEIPDNSTVCGYCGTPTDPYNSYFYGGTPQNMDGGANGMAIASMVLGIIAVLLSCCSGTRWLTVIVAVVGIVFGILALQKKEFNNRGMAIAGIVCSIVALVMGLILILLGVVGIAFLTSLFSGIHGF